VKKHSTAASAHSNTASQEMPKSGYAAARQRQSATSRALHLLLSNTIEFLLNAGGSPKHIALELMWQAKRVNGRKRIGRVRDAGIVQNSHKRWVEITGVVSDWHREPAYTNQDGDPLQLTQRSLRALVGKRFPRREVSAVVWWMLENGIVRRTSSGKIALIGGRQVVLRRAVVLERAAALIPQYLRTTLRNADTQNPYSRDIDRDARVFYLPEKYVPLWREVVRERGRSFLEGVDNWLEDHAHRDESGPVREVGVHCYAYTGDSRPSKRASMNVRRPRVGV
jgi:hypothetical protein